MSSKRRVETILFQLKPSFFYSKNNNKNNVNGFSSIIIMRSGLHLANTTATASGGGLKGNSEEVQNLFCSVGMLKPRNLFESSLHLSKLLNEKYTNISNVEERVKILSHVSSVIETTSNPEHAMEKLLSEIAINMENSPQFLLRLREDVLFGLEATTNNPVMKKNNNGHNSFGDFDAKLKKVLQYLFCGGLLKLERISLHSTGLILEQIIEKEAVHKITTLTEIKRRLKNNRRVFGFFHPSLPQIPLAFIHVALMKKNPAKKLKEINSENLTDVHPKSAVFYTISSTQKGLTGIDLGALLIKRVVDALRVEFPSLQTFSTLSPIPKFVDWLKKNENKNEDIKTFLSVSEGEGETNEALKQALGSKLVARYLYLEKTKGRSACNVLNFHVRNGAQLWRINYNADPSEKGRKESKTFMVNYLYELNDLERNSNQYVLSGEIPISDVVKELLL